MIKTKPKLKASARSVARKTTCPATRKRPAIAPPKHRAKRNTKHARIVAMLQSTAGATIARMMTATDWQQHSVRGFLAGIVRKKLGFNLVSVITDKGRVYRIKDVGSASAGTGRAKQTV